MYQKLRLSTKLKAAAITAGAFVFVVGGTALAAGGGILPGPVQNAVSGAASALHVHFPGATTDSTGSTTTTGEISGDTTGTTRPATTGTSQSGTTGTTGAPVTTTTTEGNWGQHVSSLRAGGDHTPAAVLMGKTVPGWEKKNPNTTLTSAPVLPGSNGGHGTTTTTTGAPGATTTTTFANWGGYVSSLRAGGDNTPAAALMGKTVPGWSNKNPNTTVPTAPILPGANGKHGK